MDVDDGLRLETSSETSSAQHLGSHQLFLFSRSAKGSKYLRDRMMGYRNPFQAQVSYTTQLHGSFGLSDVRPILPLVSRKSASEAWACRGRLFSEPPILGLTTRLRRSIMTIKTINTNNMKNDKLNNNEKVNMH